MREHTALLACVIRREAPRCSFHLDGQMPEPQWAGRASGMALTLFHIIDSYANQGSQMAWRTNNESISEFWQIHRNGGVLDFAGGKQGIVSAGG